MTSESNASFEIDTPVVFTTGTVGEPGHRVFYVQAQGDGQVVTLKLEKQQVGALAEYLSGLLADLPTVDESHIPTLLDLVGPDRARVDRRHARRRVGRAQRPHGARRRRAPDRGRGRGGRGAGDRAVPGHA